MLRSGHCSPGQSFKRKTNLIHLKIHTLINFDQFQGEAYYGLYYPWKYVDVIYLKIVNFKYVNQTDFIAH